MRLTRKDVLFEWLEDQQQAFEVMVTRFTTALILRHFDHKTEGIIEMDVSD
jgi:hypothetical protein